MWMWHLGTSFSAGLTSAGLWLDSMIFKVFSNLNNSVPLEKYWRIQRGNTVIIVCPLRVLQKAWYKPLDFLLLYEAVRVSEYSGLQGTHKDHWVHGPYGIDPSILALLTLCSDQQSQWFSLPCKSSAKLKSLTASHRAVFNTLQKPLSQNKHCYS